MILEINFFFSCSVVETFLLQVAETFYGRGIFFVYFVSKDYKRKAVLS